MNIVDEIRNNLPRVLIRIIMEQLFLCHICKKDQIIISDQEFNSCENCQKEFMTGFQYDTLRQLFYYNSIAFPFLFELRWNETDLEIFACPHSSCNYEYLYGHVQMHQESVNTQIENHRNRLFHAGHTFHDIVLKISFNRSLSILWDWKRKNNNTNKADKDVLFQQAFFKFCLQFLCLENYCRRNFSIDAYNFNLAIQACKNVIFHQRIGTCRH